MAKIKFLSELMGAQGAAFSSNVLGNVQANKPGDTSDNSKFGGKVAYENEEVSKVDRARRLLKSMLSNDDYDRQEVLDKLMRTLQITEETATSYFQRIAKEMGLTNHGSGGGKASNTGMSADDKDEKASTSSDENSQEQYSPDTAQAATEVNAAPIDPDGDPNKQGVIRVIQNAHLVYKRQNEEGTFTELWIYNINDVVKDELETRRDILAGTDIPPRRSQSPDGAQSYRLKTMGNAQMIEISGLPQ